jgi:hypothetical protein
MRERKIREIDMFQWEISKHKGYVKHQFIMSMYELLHDEGHTRQDMKAIENAYNKVYEKLTGDSLKVFKGEQHKIPNLNLIHDVKPLAKPF